MNAIPDLIPLHDNRPGVRALLQVEIREAESVAPAAEPSAQRLENSQPCLDFIASTATLDRYQEVIEPGGWRLDSYRKNPVFQNAHNYGDVLFTLGRALITEIRSGPSTLNPQPSTFLFQRIEFATEVNPVARIAYGLYKGRFLNAVSVGFIPLRWEDGGNSSGGTQSKPGPRRRFLEQELLEVSAVAIPANPDALALGLKSGAIVKSDIEDTLELMTAVVGSFRRNDRRLDDSQRSVAVRKHINSQLFQFARELRRVMRQA